MTHVSDVMKKSQVFCVSDTRIAEIKYLMKKYNYEEIVVVDTMIGKHPVGVIHESDVENEKITHHLNPSDISAKECMEAITSVKEDLSLDECLLAMEESHRSRLPVVDSNGQIVGVVSLDELI